MEPPLEIGEWGLTPFQGKNGDEVELKIKGKDGTMSMFLSAERSMTIGKSMMAMGLMVQAKKEKEALARQEKSE